MIFPGGGRTIRYNYGSTPLLGATRVADTCPPKFRRRRVADGTGQGRTKYAQYTYLGAAIVVQAAHPAVNGGLTLTYGSPGDAGGGFAGFDRGVYPPAVWRGRIIDQKWTDAAGTAVRDRVRYGYNRASSRIWRYNAVDPNFSEYYLYDGLHRLTESKRGVLGGTDPNFTPPATVKRTEDWTLDFLGNWKAFKIDANGPGGAGNWELEQSRTHNKVNEITAIGQEANQPAWIDPDHDAAGNMVLMPDARTPTAGLRAVYDAWNRLVQATTDAGEIVVTYRYDGLNRRIAKLFGADPVHPTSREDHYYNESWQLLEVRRDGDADPYEQIVWDIRYIDSPICRFRDGDLDGAYDKTAAGVDDNLYFANDGNFNVTALVSPSSGRAVCIHPLRPADHLRRRLVRRPCLGLQPKERDPLLRIPLRPGDGNVPCAE